MAGGAFMVAIGLLYLGLGDAVLLGSTRSTSKTGNQKLPISRIVTGVQV